jgi:hypothetical protein
MCGCPLLLFLKAFHCACWLLTRCCCHGYAPAQFCLTLFVADPSILIGFYIYCFVSEKKVGSSRVPAAASSDKSFQK